MTLDGMWRSTGRLYVLAAGLWLVVAIGDAAEGSRWDAAADAMIAAATALVYCETRLLDALVAAWRDRAIDRLRQEHRP